jgi:uncharacterized protein (DUF1778 family)
MATARLDMKLDASIKIMAEKASALLGRKSLTEYVVGLMEKDAKKVIAEYESMTVKVDIFDCFMDACENTNKPNQSLRDAVAFTREQGIK